MTENYKTLIGKTAKLTKQGVKIENLYNNPLKMGYYKAMILFDYCYRPDEFQISFQFVDEPPETQNGITYYCLKQIGKHSSGDWYWFTLDQLMICDE